MAFDLLVSMKCLKLSLLLLIVVAGLSCGPERSMDKGNDILSQMRQQLGLPDAKAGLNIYALADCSGPTSVFETLVISGPANTRFEQKSESGHNLGVHREDSAWMHDFVADTSFVVDSTTITFLIGHELHAIAYYPEKRFGKHLSEKDTVFYGEEARMFTFIDIKGGPVKVFYKHESWLPLGFTVKNHSGRGAAEVNILFDNWQELNGVRAFTEARFLQGADVYHYQFTKIRFGELPKDAFTKNQALILP